MSGDKSDLTPLVQPTPPGGFSGQTPHQQLGGEFGRMLIRMLGVISVLMLFAWVLLERARLWQMSLSNCDLPQNASEQQLARCTELIKQVGALYEGQRKDLLSLAQIVLINLLLPLLTAVFGYTFGRERGKQDP